MLLGGGFETLRHSFQPLTFFTKKFALVVNLFAAGGGPAVGAEARFWASAKGEGDVDRQIVLPAHVSRVSYGTSGATKVIGTLAVSTFAVAKLILVGRVTVGPLFAHEATPPSRQAAFRADGFSFMAIIGFVLAGGEAVSVPHEPVAEVLLSSFQVVQFFLLTRNPHVRALSAVVDYEADKLVNLICRARCKGAVGATHTIVSVLPVSNHDTVFVLTVA